MLALDPSSPPLGSAEQFGLDLLLDLSRVLRFEGQGDVVRLRIVDGGESVTLASCLARGWHVARGEGTVAIPRAVLGLVTAIAGVESEQRDTRRDRYGRVPPEANDLVAAGQERSPVLSLAAVDLRRAVIDVAARRPVRLLAPWPKGHRWAVALSHDLDVVAPWPAFTALRLVELARKGELGRVTSVIGAAGSSLAGDPVWEGVQGVLDAERAHAARSTWFVLCGTPTFATMRAGDLTYLPESPAARRIISAVLAAGHTVELHGSFATYTDTARFREQRARLGEITKSAPVGVRQHYLRMQPGLTQRAMVDAGFRHDSTFGFADRNGFRQGVADVLPMWSAADQASISIDEVPFVWMDRALSKYRGIETPDAWIDDALEIAAACRAVDGVWCGIWHPNLTPALGFPGAPRAYARLVTELATRSPLFETTEAIVAWRRARRAARGAAIDAAGSVVPSANDRQSRFTIELEDASGRRVAERAASSA